MIRFLGNENSVHSFEDAQCVIVPVPLEYSTSYGTGTAIGPRAIIEASPYLEFYDEELDMEPWKTGIFTTPAVDVKGTPEICLRNIEEELSGFLSDDKFLIVIGGEHSLSYAVNRALMARYPGLSVLHFDAHSDMRDSYEGSRFSHACVMRRIREDNQNTVSIGIRSQCVEERNYILENRVPIYYAHEFRNHQLVPDILDQLSKDVFITFDTDFFDPAIMPGVGTPEPGGFFWYETLAMLKSVFDNKNVVGMDIVEFSPIENLIHPQFLLAKFIYKMIGYKINRVGSKI
jgi:agmatinase